MSERGSVTIWLLGLVVALLFLGGLSLDLWRVFAVRRELVGLADGAAIVGAGAIDEAAFRGSGAVRLDPVRARQRAVAYLRARLDPGVQTRLRAGVDFISVRLECEVDLTLLRLLAPQERVPVAGGATVRPARSP